MRPWRGGDTRSGRGGGRELVDPPGLNMIPLFYTGTDNPRHHTRPKGGALPRVRRARPQPAIIAHWLSTSSPQPPVPVDGRKIATLATRGA